MKNWVLRLMAVAVLAIVGFWLWNTFFPKPEKVIRQRLARVAKLASFASRQGNLTAMANVSSLMEYFTPDVEIVVEAPEVGEWNESGREQIRNLALAARNNLSSLNVKFLDMNVTVAADKQTATVDLTAQVTTSADKDFMVHEMKFTLRDTGGDWLVSKIETVKTLK